MDSLQTHVAKALHKHLKETQFPEWPTWDKLVECTQCMETAMIVIEAANSYKHSAEKKDG